MSPSGRLLVVVLAVAAACAKAPPRTTPPPPPPPPPAPPLVAESLVTAVRMAEATPSVPVSELVAPPEPAPAPRRPAAPPPPPAEPEPPERPPVPLGTPETADAEAATRRVNATLDRAREALAKVRPVDLSRDARVQYQTARQLIEQADEAVKAHNLLYAIRLADKAETLARRLAGGESDGRPAA